MIERHEHDRCRLRCFMKALAVFITVLIAPAGAEAVAGGAIDLPPPRANHERPGAIHPSVRRTASPADGKTVSVNPPPLLWPATRGAKVRYNVRLSQDPEFPQPSTKTARGLPWAMFNPHEKLGDGVWYWQYAVTDQPDQPSVGARRCEWSPVFRFVVDRSARTFVTPSAAEMIAACPKEHPRILTSPEGLALVRDRLKDSVQWSTLTKGVGRYVGRSLPDESKAFPTEQGADQYQSKNFAKWASKAYAGDLAGSISDLVPAYLASGDDTVGREAVRRALFIARLDPDGPTSPKVSDFADGSCMRAMGLVYDCCYDLMSATEKALLQEAMSRRASRFFAHQVNNLETKVFNAHVWQHILMDFTDVALALLGEVPEAETWTSYVYELWIARFPLLGGDDGGWANGVNYFGTNFNTLLGAPTLFTRFTGVDFFDHPWYRNTIYYQLYAWPPGSASDGFGDGSEREETPSGRHADFMQVLGTKVHDPYALWYAEKISGGRSAGSLPPLSLLRRLGCQTSRLPPPKSPADLPQARAFRDVGIVSMHTNLSRADDDLMIGFRSSPFGSHNHMHACQNSFNLLYGGQRLFSGSGYYIAYGDDHFRGWYTATRGHNSILIDDTGQVRGEEGFGYVARFLHGRQISYCLGDASNAYGDAGLTTFRRHLVLLRPSTIVVYDELAADHPARWSWLLHSGVEITVDEGRQRLAARTDTAAAHVDLLGSTRLELSVDNRFDPPAINWRKRKSGGKLVNYPDQWHATAKPLGRSPRTRFLAVMQVQPSRQPGGFAKPVVTDGGGFVLGQWTIRAELDPSRKASLIVQDADGQAVLGADVRLVTAGGKRYDLDDATSILVEADEGTVDRAADELPPAASWE